MQEQLFEMPAPAPPKKRGRPRIRISHEKQQLIEAALRGGMSGQAIAEALGYDPKTIRRYLSRPGGATVEELERASIRLRKMSSELDRIAAEILNVKYRSKGRS